MFGSTSVKKEPSASMRARSPSRSYSFQILGRPDPYASTSPRRPKRASRRGLRGEDSRVIAWCAVMPNSPPNEVNESSVRYIFTNVGTQRLSS